jgi:3-carboxy-cis,cis-muconate cycloisomerase
MRAVFSDEALARAQARAGVVPQSAADAIHAAAQAVVIDFDKLRRETEIVGYPILPLVRQLSEAAGEARKFVSLIG